MKFTRSDAAITAAVLALSSVLFFFFLRDVNSLSSGAAADALGTIEFRKNTATRKAADSMRWERLRDKATVYRGDTIRTAELSEAGIKFDDGTELAVFENSMLRLDVSDAGQTFELSGGAMRIAGGEGGAGSGANRVIKIGGSVVSVPADADVSMLSSSGVVSLDVAGGAVSVTSASGVKTSVGENEELKLDTKTGALEVVKRSVVPVAPAQGARFAFAGTDGAVSFSARASGSVESLSLEVSADSAFSSASSRVPLARGDGDSFAAETPVASGVWYWRVVSDAGEVSAARRITVVSSSPPAPVWPEDGAVIGFRKEIPKIRFSWSESSGAEAYTLELRRASGAAASPGSGATVDLSVAPERSVRTKLTAITLSSLAEGYWTWRVVPEYPASFVASPVPSASRRFSVAPSDEMRPVALLSPAGESPVERGASVAFSWGANAEAARYELRLYATPDDPSPVASFSSDRSWMTLDGTRAPALAQDGAKYWLVAWFDADGNESPASERRKIVVVDARAAIVPLFPPDGYTVADSLAQGVRFAWKGADAPGLSFQLSHDASFAAIERTVPVSGNSLLGLSLARGEWYWRLRIPNPDGSAFFESEARSFSVVPPFAAPVLKNPKPGSSVTVLEGKSVAFEIGIADGALKGSLKGAARYSCKLYRVDANSPAADAPEANALAADALAAEKPAFSAENLEPTGSLSVSCSVPLGSMPEGAYRVVLQAYAADATGNTAIGGYLGEETLFVGKIVPVEFSAPKKNAVIDGVSARRSGVTIRWKSEFAPDSLRVALSRDGSPYPLEFAWKPGVSSLRLESLPPGAYSVAISAKIGTFDVSPPAPLRFTVAEISRLSAPVLTAPADKAVFDQTYLSTRGEIVFQWKPVKGATDYAFRILSDLTGKEVYRRERLTATSLTLDDLSCLDKGKFTWEVVAGNYAADGTVDQIGKATSARFTVSLPDLSLPKGAKDAEYYGY